MGRYLTILLLLFTHLAWGQVNCTGDFSTRTLFGGCRINFSNDSIFEYSSYSCTQDFRGAGIYRIIKNKIELHYTYFENMSLFYLNLLMPDSPIKNSCQTTDSTTFKILVLNQLTNAPLDSIKLQLKFPQEDTLQTFTNSNGEANFTFKKTDSSGYIFIKQPFRSYGILSNGKECSAYKFFVTPINPVKSEFEIKRKTYSIIKMTCDLLKLTDTDDNSQITLYKILR